MSPQIQFSRLKRVRTRVIIRSEAAALGDAEQEAIEPRLLDEVLAAHLVEGVGVALIMFGNPIGHRRNPAGR
jgi:hypothetical protein